MANEDSLLDDEIPVEGDTRIWAVLYACPIGVELWVLGNHDVFGDLPDEVAGDAVSRDCFALHATEIISRHGA